MPPVCGVLVIIICVSCVCVIIIYVGVIFQHIYFGKQSDKTNFCIGNMYAQRRSAIHIRR